MLGSRGLRDLDTGPERIESDADRAAVRRQTHRIARRAALTAILFTAAYLALTGT